MADEKNEQTIYAEAKERYETLDKEARRVAVAIGQHEAKIEHVLEELQEAFPDQEFNDPRAIPFTELIAEYRTKLEELMKDVNSLFETVEQKVENAESELRNVISTKN